MWIRTLDYRYPQVGRFGNGKKSGFSVRCVQDWQSDEGGRFVYFDYFIRYQPAPVSAITYYAEVDSIEAYGDGGKYKLNFKEKAKKINPIKLGNAKPGSLQGPRYTNLEEMLKANSINELFEK